MCCRNIGPEIAILQCSPRTYDPQIQLALYKYNIFFVLFCFGCFFVWLGFLTFIALSISSFF